jgi:hypothetical protein
MTAEDDRPTIAERYAVAIGAGGDSDVVLAAGLQRHRLGALLMRLRSEYDGVRLDLERAGQIRARNIGAGRELLRQAAVLEAAAKRADADFFSAEANSLARRAAALVAEAAAIDVQRTAHEIVSARAFVLLELKSLYQAKREVGAAALKMSKKPSLRINAETALRLAGAVLDVFLDPICHDCDGTGLKSAMYSSGVDVPCERCRRTGQRRDTIGSGTHQRMFSALLLGEIDRQCQAAAREMGIALRSDDSSESERDPALRARLSDLDSREAVSD